MPGAFDWGVGQLADRPAVNREVGGSSPPAPALHLQAPAFPLGYPRPTLDREAHSHARPGEHVDQGVDAEAMEAPPHEIVHARLAHAQELRCSSLREPAARNEALER